VKYGALEITVMGSISTWAFSNSTAIMNFLAVFALGLSAWQLYAARSQTNALKQISQSLTTRYLGQFPDFYDNIIEIVSAAKTSVKTIYDLPAYACFSRTEEWLQFDHQLTLLSQRGIDIKIGFYADAQRRRMLREQFHYDSPKSWEAWRQRSDVSVKMEKFRRLYAEQNVDIEDQEDFLLLLDNVHDQTAKRFEVLHRGVSISSLISIYAWIVDENVAIFVLPSYTGGLSEYGFITNDARVVAALSNMIDRILAQHSSS
jgi:hypothetical protein